MTHRKLIQDIIGDDPQFKNKPVGIGYIFIFSNAYSNLLSKINLSKTFQYFFEKKHLIMSIPTYLLKLKSKSTQPNEICTKMFIKII